MLGIKQEDDTRDTKKDGWIGPAPWIETPLPGPTAKAVIERDERYSSPSYTRDYPLVVKRALGSVVEDVDGNRFLDFAAGIAVCATGHCHPKVVDAIERQARSLIHICGSDFYYPPMTELMEKLSDLVPGDKPQRVFLTNSGTEAVEAAIKLSRYHTKKKWIIAFHGAFHGRTMGSLSLTCSKGVQQARFGPMMPMVTHVPYGDVDSIEEKLFRYKIPSDEVAAIFVEAFQGEGGYIVPEPTFLPRLRELCDRHKILLVLDEIQSGMGRTGKWFAFEHFGVEPDIVLMAKGLASGMPLGAVIAPSEIMNWPPGAHGSTFGGNPICCAAALATMELVKSTFLANAATLGEQLIGELGSIAANRKFITNPRGLGLMCAVDVVGKRSGKPDAKLRNRILQATFERGLIMLGCGETSIRFCPPLCINQTQLDVGLKLFDEVVGSIT
ncbi:MAG: acetyl ornithine aminotransferase family protein [Planctomycetes bacterium]|nr:acetyl ornithine aminotransferase family protein [Planctomycetota bacterium]